MIYRKKMQPKPSNQRESGFSMVELGLVVTLMGIMTAIAVPQLIGQRRLLRTAAIPREMMTLLRNARQLAMSERESFTFQYNNITKQILIIDNNASGTAVLNSPSYPNNPGSKVVVTSSLAVGGLSSTEINYGIPTGIPTAALDDSVSRTNLTSGKVNITFQSDGSIVDANGNPLDRALFIYNSQSPKETAFAISIVGSAGRVKLWRYDKTANKYVE